MYNKIVEKFISSPSDKKKLVVIYGPTASGKTDMSIEIAKELGTEIISTDSRQIFRHMDIMTGKITPEEMEGVKHYMIDILDPDEKFSMWAFVKNSEEIMKGLWAQWKIPMLVWGTGLYIDSLIFERNASEVWADKDLREELTSMSDSELYQRLKEIDPEYASELHPNNRHYVERGIEVKILTWKSKREFREERTLKYDILFLNAGYKCPEYNGKQEFIFTTEYRVWLYDRINFRVEKMIEQWWEEELRKLLDMWYLENDFGMNSIGYRELFPYLRGEISYEEAIEKVKQHSRNYAKRQLTWFKRYKEFLRDF